MILETKRKVLEYIKAHNDGTEETRQLIVSLESACSYIDINTHSVCPEDLRDFWDQKALREKLGKKDDEAYTLDDCERVADALAEFICEDFSEDLANTVRYQL